jgi:hypothetical protein
MRNSRLALLAIFVALPLTSNADITASGLPDNAVWYVHADLEAMRSSESGRQLYAWFEDEVVDEVREELGIDLSSEVNSITAFSDSNDGTAIIVEGPISESTQEKMLAIAVLKSKLETRQYKGQDYYYIGEGPESGVRKDDSFNSLEKVSYSSFAIKNKAIITSNENRLKALMDNDGKIAGSGSHDGALFILSADKSFVQAGARTGALSDKIDDDDWQSNILSNTEQAALLISDKSGNIAIEARLVSTDPKMAEAIGGIVNGLIALQMFNSEIPAEYQGLLRNTKVNVNDNTLTVSMIVDPDMVVSVLAD